MNNDLAYSALDKFLKASNMSRVKLAKAAGIHTGSFQSSYIRRNKIKYENAELLYKAMHNITFSIKDTKQQGECLNAVVLFDEAYSFALSRSVEANGLLKAAKADIAALLWLNGNCEYCKYGKHPTYSGANRWECSREDGKCEPEWRGITRCYGGQYND